MNAARGAGRAFVGRPCQRMQHSKSPGRKSKFFATKSKPGATNSKSSATKSKLNPCISFVESSLINELRRPPGRFSLFRRFRPLERRRSVGVACSLGAVCPFCLRFRVLRFSRASEGLAPFRIADAWTPLVRPGGRELRGNRGNRGVRGSRVMSPGTEDPWKRQGDRSDVRQEYVRLKARSGVRPLNQRTGASPSCLKSVSQCLSSSLIPSVSFLMRMRPLFVGRVQTPFIQR
jgi:hypothetical protein